MCGGKLAYLTRGRELTCILCQKTEYAAITCPKGHYVCDECHGKGLFDTVTGHVLKATSRDPLAIAEELMDRPDLPMLGCEHAWIAAGSFMSALRNEGTLKIRDKDILEAMQRTRRQAIGGYCGATGICGIAPAVGSCFSVVLGAACPKDEETRITMQAAGQMVLAIAGQAGPCCCKNFVRTALSTAGALARDVLGADLPEPRPVVCRHSESHPHGCREDLCLYFK